MQDHKRNKFVPLTVEAENNQTVYALAKIKELEEERDALRHALTKEVESRVAYWKASRYEVMALESHVEQMRSALSRAYEGAARQLAEPRDHKNDQYALFDIATTCESALASTPKQSLAAIKVKTLREVAAKLETEAFARCDGSFHDAAVFVEQEADEIEKGEA